VNDGSFEQTGVLASGGVMTAVAAGVSVTAGGNVTEDASGAAS